MIFKPDEVSNLKKGKQIYVEIKEDDIRILRRNYCGVYELYPKNNNRKIEYFEDLNLFKNRYGSLKKKFPLYNLSRQRLDIYPIAESLTIKDLLKWFQEYGKVSLVKTDKYEDIEIDYYTFISDMESTLSNFQIVKSETDFTLNISIKTDSKIKKAV
ncbi:MAG: hypothetical protein N2448_03370 [Caloramator sp.]|nr:hypothetical protein [Caloramator sp.]